MARSPYLLPELCRFQTCLTMTSLASWNRRLSEYIRDPQVSVFDEEDKSRTVRVMGLVNKPGLIVLASPRESLMDAFAEAGGLRDDASQRILFIPGRRMAPADLSRQRRPAGLTLECLWRVPPLRMTIRRDAPIVMDLHDEAQDLASNCPPGPVIPSSFRSRAMLPWTDGSPIAVR